MRSAVGVPPPRGAGLSTCTFFSAGFTAGLGEPPADLANLKVLCLLQGLKADTPPTGSNRESNTSLPLLLLHDPGFHRRWTLLVAEG